MDSPCQFILRSLENSLRNYGLDSFTKTGGGCFVNLGENKDPNIRGLFYLYDLVSICTFMPAGMASVAASAIRVA